MSKGGPHPHGAHSPATCGWMDIQLLLVLQETLGYFITHGKSERICPLELLQLLLPFLEADDLGQFDSLLRTSIPTSIKWAST